MKIFDKNINFDLLQDKNIKEDVVREEVIAPILKALGYSSFTENRIIRSKSLVRPDVHFGTVSKKIYMIPDYTIQVEGKNCFIIEAKNPRENILTGNNPEQAYSYAIHREIKVDKYVLCNGVDIVVFDVDQLEPVLKLQISELEKEWEKLYRMLSPRAFTNPHIFYYKPDLGIRMLKLGVQPNITHNFYNAKISDVTKINEKYYSFSLGGAFFEGEECLGTFDFERSLFDNFMSQVPQDKKGKVLFALTKQPFRYDTKSEEESFGVSFLAVLSYKLEKGKDELFMPFLVEEFLNKN